MSRPIQIILEGEALPYTSQDRYTCYEEDLSTLITMAAQNMVKEIPAKSKVWQVQYSYDYMGNEKCRRVLTILRQNSSILASVLPNTGDELIVSKFFVTSITQPTFAFSRDGVGLWHNLAFTLREVEPHD